MHLFTEITVIVAIISVAKCRISQKHEIHREGTRLITGNKTVPCPKESDYKDGVNNIKGDNETSFSPKEPAEGRRMLNDRVEQRQEEIAEVTSKTYALKMFPELGDVQIKINIELVMKKPSRGECIEKFEIVDGKGEFMIPVLCGVVTKQNLHIDVNIDNGPYEIRMTLSDPPTPTGVWKINSIVYLKEYPGGIPGCLQYLNKPTGTLQSFNFGGQVGDEIPYQALINQDYKICFAKIEGYCNINFDFSRFDLGEINQPCTGDYLLIGGEQLCGDLGPDDNMTRNKIEGISLHTIVDVIMDGDNTDEVEGFSGTYTMIPCDEPSVRTSKPSARTPNTIKSSTTPSKSQTTIYDFFNLFLS